MAVKNTDVGKDGRNNLLFVITTRAKCPRSAYLPFSATPILFIVCIITALHRNIIAAYDSVSLSVTLTLPKVITKWKANPVWS